MYVPEYFAADADALLARLVRTCAGILVTLGEDGAPEATHTPIVWDAERQVATGHIARANPHWKQGPCKALIIVAGPEAYVSPNWYPSKAEHGKQVPTWNYEAVHLTGSLDWFDDADRLEALLRALTDQYESGRADPWSFDDAPADYVKAMLRGIVGFELRAERVEGKRKLAQHKPEADFDGVIAGLEQFESGGAVEIAALMRELRAK